MKLPQLILEHLPGVCQIIIKQGTLTFVYQTEEKEVEAEFPIRQYPEDWTKSPLIDLILSFVELNNPVDIVIDVLSSYEYQILVDTNRNVGLVVESNGTLEGYVNYKDNQWMFNLENPTYVDIEIISNLVYSNLVSINNTIESVRVMREVIDLANNSEDTNPDEEALDVWVEYLDAKFKEIEDFPYDKDTFIDIINRYIEDAEIKNVVLFNLAVESFRSRFLNLEGE